jgi:hypothetical protein
MTLAIQKKEMLRNRGTKSASTGFAGTETDILLGGIIACCSFSAATYDARMFDSRAQLACTVVREREFGAQKPPSPNCSIGGAHVCLPLQRA